MKGPGRFEEGWNGPTAFSGPESRADEVAINARIRQANLPTRIDEIFMPLAR